VNNDNNSILFSILSFGGILSGGIIFILLGLFLLAAKLAIVFGVIYFFLAAGGVLPPLDFVPFIPYV
jgi:hypothetical protein